MEENITYYLEVSSDGKTYKPFYIAHRLRKYSCVQNAINAASHLIKGKHKEARIVSFFDKRIKARVTIKNGATAIRYLTDVRYSNVPYLYSDKNQEPNRKYKQGSLDFEKVAKSKDIPDSDLPKAEDNDVKPECSNLCVVVARKEDGTTPNAQKCLKKDYTHAKSKDENTKGTRTDLIKAKWEDVKSNKNRNVDKGRSLNTLGSCSQLSDPVFFCNFMSVTIDFAIRDGDPGLLFKLELMLSDKGYSWYVDDNKVLVDKTENVVKLIKGKIPMG